MALGLWINSVVNQVISIPESCLNYNAAIKNLHLQNSIKEFPTPSGFKAEIEGVRCEIGKRKEGRFEVREVRGMNFGSVHLYLAKTK